MMMFTRLRLERKSLNWFAMTLLRYDVATTYISFCLQCVRGAEYIYFDIAVCEILLS